MTKGLLPPELEAEISALKGRVSKLEKKLRERIPEIPGVSKEFNLSGTIYATASEYWTHPRGANLVFLIGILKETSSSGPVEISARKNDSRVGELLTIEEGNTFNRTKLSPGIRYAEGWDLLDIEIVDPGVDAAGLTVIAVFDG